MSEQPGEQGQTAPPQDTRWRKKPVEVEAWQWPGIPAGVPVQRVWTPEICSDCRGASKSGAPIQCELHEGPYVHAVKTLEGFMVVSDGDWIIKGVKGEFYPCKPDIFATTYEPASQPAPAASGQATAATETDEDDFTHYFNGVMRMRERAERAEAALKQAQKIGKTHMRTGINLAAELDAERERIATELEAMSYGNLQLKQYAASLRSAASPAATDTSALATGADADGEKK